MLDDAAQLDLTPGAADVGGAQRPREGAGLAPQRLLGVLHRQQLGVESSPLHRALALQLADVALDPGQARRQRSQGQSQLGVVVGVVAQLVDATAQQVALRGDGSVASGGRGAYGPRRDRRAEGGAGQQAHEHGHGEVHVHDRDSRDRQWAGGHH